MLRNQRIGKIVWSKCDARRFFQCWITWRVQITFNTKSWGKLLIWIWNTKLARCCTNFNILTFSNKYWSFYRSDEDFTIFAQINKYLGSVITYINIAILAIRNEKIQTIQLSWRFYELLACFLSKLIIFSI